MKTNTFLNLKKGFVLCLISCFLFNVSKAISISVPTDFATIQEAIDSANNGDTILVMPGTYTGIGNKNLDFFGKSLFLTSTKGADSTIIDCELNGRAFYFHSSEDSNAVINGFTIQNGKVDTSAGGGIFCDWSSPTISNCIIRNCSALRAGGIHIGNSSLTLSNCQLDSNSAKWSGALACNNSSPVISNSSFRYNTSDCNGTLSIIERSSPVIKNCVIEYNTQRLTCDGIMIAHNESNPYILNTKIINNSSHGFFVTVRSNVTLTNCLIAKNAGHGIWTSNSDSGITIRNTNIIFNEGQGILSQRAKFKISNTIIYGNSKEEIYVTNTPVPDVSFSLIEGKDAGEIYGHINWSGQNYDQYPDFVDTLNQDYQLQSSSVCKNNGNPNQTIAINETDLNGNSRIMGNAIDIGAYELPGPPTGIFETNLGKKEVLISSVFPNPTRGNVSLTFEETNSYVLDVFNSLGQSIKTLACQSCEEIVINLEGLTNGFYIIKVRSGTTSEMIKLVKE